MSFEGQFTVKITRKILLVALWLCFFGALSGVNVPPLAAQTPAPAPNALRWSAPRRIPGFADDTDPPFLIADRNHTVHAFFSQWTGGDLAIMYTQWSLNSSWSRPIDILLSPNAQQATILGAFLDSRGMVHVAFFGGTAQGAEIYHSSAPLEQAGKASAWSRPEIVGQRAVSPVAGMLTGDDRGNLFILYSGGLEGNGMYLIRSTDYGETWSAPETVFLTESASLWVAPIQGVLDAQGQLHVMWTVANKAGNGEAVYYSRLERDHRRWTRPFAMQTIKGNDYEADWGAVAALGNELFVLYDYGFPPQRWMRRSTDGGRGWSEPVVAFPSKGEYGFPMLLADSNNTLHAVLGNRSADDSVHGMWHSMWTGERWTDLQAIVSGPQTQQFDPNRPSAVVSQGNVMLVTWRTDPGLTPNGVWFSYATLASPELAVQALPTPVPSPTATVQVTAQPKPTLAPSPTPTRIAAAPGGAITHSISPNDSLMMTIALTVAVVMTLVAIVFLARRLQAFIFR